jgi:hypothetical protein
MNPKFLLVGAVAAITVLAPASASGAVTANPSSLAFAPQAFETPSPSQAVTVTVAGDTFTRNIFFTGANFSDFSQTNNCGAVTATDCTINVTFRPSKFAVNGSSTRTATMTIGSSMTGPGPDPVTLAGTATEPAPGGGDGGGGAGKKCKKGKKKGASSAKKKCRKKKKKK